jgi:hypothetical protein
MRGGSGASNGTTKTLDPELKSRSVPAALTEFYREWYTRVDDVQQI